MIIQEQGFAGFAGRSGRHGLGGHSARHGLGDSLDNIESSDAPSRSMWFLIGAVTAFLGPTLLNVVSAGGSRAARRLGR